MRKELQSNSPKKSTPFIERYGPGRWSLCMRKYTNAKCIKSNAMTNKFISLQLP